MVYPLLNFAIAAEDNITGIFQIRALIPPFSRIYHQIERYHLLLGNSPPELQSTLREFLQGFLKRERLLYHGKWTHLRKDPVIHRHNAPALFQPLPPNAQTYVSAFEH